MSSKYDCVRGRGGGKEDPTWEVNPSADTLRGYVDTAILEGSWHLVGFHGIGPNCEWGGPVDGEAFTALLDYLEEKRPIVWSGTHTEVHKYDQERSTAAIHTLEATDTQIRLELVLAKDSRLYDYPLTLHTRLPAGWKTVRVTQNGIAFPYIVTADIVQYDATPGKGEISITVA